jgi:hypothetical protein
MNTQKIDPTKPVVVSQSACLSPRSEEGKQISSRNAIRHGCCSDTLILPAENMRDFEALEAAWYRAYCVDPNSVKDETEAGLISKLIVADWLAQRATRHYVQVEAKILAAQPDPTEWNEEQHKTLTRFQRYRTANNNAFEKHRRAVEDHRKNRIQDIARTQTLRVKEEQVALVQERLKTAQEKNKPEPTWKEHLEGMRQKAIALGYTPPDLTQR